jgi:four helix bundle protein
MRPHENLEVWKKSIEIALVIYKVTESFPKEEKFGLTSQLGRAAVSIPANMQKALPVPKERILPLSFECSRIGQRS